MTYNDDGQRVGKLVDTTTSKFIYDLGKLHNESNEADNSRVVYTNSLHNQFGNLITQFRQTQSSYFEQDALGSVISMVDSSELEKNSYVYRAFGRIESSSETLLSDITYVGKLGYFDESSLGLYLLRARYYDPAVGWFLSRDPIGFAGGDVNLYRYVGNNPVNRVDPSGLIFGCTKPTPPRTRKQCCDDARKTPVPGGDAERKPINLDMNNVGGIVCCDGNIWPCVWHRSGNPVVQNENALLATEFCIEQHERAHMGSVTPCDARTPLYRPGWKTPGVDYAYADEYRAYNIHLECLEEMADYCAGDPKCFEQVVSEHRSVKATLEELTQKYRKRKNIEREGGQ